jgi:hypothetical protein
MTGPLAELAIQYFRKLEPKDPKAWDWFFETFGPGNILEGTDRPYERFSDYEGLLNLLYDTDRVRYKIIHKGLPFLFLAWLACDLRNYEKALYYLDAALSEDVRSFGSDWIDMPGAQFLRLSNKSHHVGKGVISKIRRELETEVSKFIAATGFVPFTVDDVIGNFVTPLMQESNTRTMVSAFYIFLLEHGERSSELRLRSTLGSSMMPIINHLFSGALLFESILKHLYPDQDDGSPTETLGNIFHTKAFNSDFGDRITTRARSLREILDAANDNLMPTAISCTARLRNTTGHNLLWDDIFDDANNYEAMWQQVMNALLYVMHKKFIEPGGQV